MSVNRYAESNSLLKSLAEERRKRRRVPSAGQSVEADSRVEDGVRNTSKRAKSESEGCESHVKILETGSESSSCDKDVLLAQLISMGYPFEACSTALEVSGASQSFSGKSLPFISFFFPHGRLRLLLKRRRSHCSSVTLWMAALAQSGIC